MRMLGVLASAIMFVVVGATGVILCWGVAEPMMGESVVLFLYNNLLTYKGALAGVGLCAIALLSLLQLTGSRNRRENIVFAGALGEVRIAVDTVENYLANAALNVADVQKLVPHVKTIGDGNKVTVDAVVHVTVGRNIPEVTDEIQHHIADHLKSELGIAEVGEIRIHVREVRPPKPAEL